MDWKPTGNFSAVPTAPPRWASPDWPIAPERAARAETDCRKPINLGCGRVQWRGMGENLQIDIIAEPPGEALPCLKCGYDLRVNAGDRCSECGWEIDRAILGAGAFAGERRRNLGRVKPYLDPLGRVAGRGRSFPV